MAGTRVYAILAAVVATGLLLLVLAVARWRLRAVSQVERLRRGCDRGDAASCHRLGWEYEQGVRVALDPARARPLYQRACDGGYALGCFFSGTMAEGGGDRGRARDLYRRACQGGSAEGCTSLRRLDRR